MEVAVGYRLAIIGSLLSTLVLPHGVGAEPAAAATGRPAASFGVEEGGLLGHFALAAEHGPVTINAEGLEFDYRRQVLTYRGNVTVTQGDMTLHSEVLRVVLDPQVPEKPREVVAEGGVRIAKGDRLATGGRAAFDEATRTIILSDHATLRDGPNEVAGERVVVYLDEERSVVEGGDNRVRAVLFPPGVVPAEPAEPTDDR